MAKKAKRGEILKEKVAESYQSWRNHAAKGDNKKLLDRMDKYYRNLWRSDNGKSDTRDISGTAEEA